MQVLCRIASWVSSKMQLVVWLMQAFYNHIHSRCNCIIIIFTVGAVCSCPAPAPAFFVLNMRGYIVCAICLSPILLDSIEMAGFPVVISLLVSFIFSGESGEGLL